jgi:O-antigen/teichoic acid export membrane protein
MRVKNSIKNSLVSSTSTIITMIIGFIAQAIFIKTLGTEYLGINGLFGNIISIMGIVELGIGPAIIYNLYEPIVSKDIEKIKSLLKMYKISYYLVALAILVIGICILPFLSIIVGNISIKHDLYLIFMLFILDIMCSYLLTYKRSILYANQQNYIVIWIHLLYTVVLNIVQVIILIFTGNYILYLISKIIMRLIENIITTKIANNKYPYIKDKYVNKLEKNIVDDIVKKIKALIMHKVGGFVVSGTDNILISVFIGISTVGLYSNYLLIIGSVVALFSQMFTSITASIGNLLVKETKEKSFEVYKNIDFLNFWLTTFSATCIICLIQKFITIWIGKEFLLSSFVLVTIVINYYMLSMRRCTSIFKDAAGIYHEDRYIPLIESIINILASFIFMKVFGLAGIFLGTIISSLILFLYSYPKYVYTILFERKYMEYIARFIKYTFIAAFIAIITYLFTNIIVYQNNYIEFIKNIVICLILPNIMLILLYRKQDSYKYFKNLIYTKYKLN